LSIRTYKILWHTTVRLSFRSHVVWFPNIWGENFDLLFPAWISGKGKKREKPLKFLYSLHCSLFYHSFSSLDQPVLQRIIRLIDMETNDFGTSIERVKQTVNSVSYAHVSKIRLFKGILNNNDHRVVYVQRSVYLYQKQSLTILNCCTFLSTLHFSPAWKWNSFSWINLYENYKDILSGSDFKALYHRLKFSFTSEDFLTCLAWFWYIAILNAKDAAL
jgi:hypothetical protein